MTVGGGKEVHGDTKGRVVCDGKEPEERGIKTLEEEQGCQG